MVLPFLLLNIIDSYSLTDYGYNSIFQKESLVVPDEFNLFSLTF